MGVQSRGTDGGETVTVTQSGDWYVAKDEATGIASQGETKARALENLADALELSARSVPEERVERVEPSSAPWFSE
ncbi:hypothetical protein GCM10025298_23560 [Natronobiforma cellulositropha]